MGIEGLKIEAARATQLLQHHKLAEGLQLYEVMLREGKVASTSKTTDSGYQSGRVTTEHQSGIVQEIVATRKKVEAGLKQAHVPSSADSSMDLATEVEALKKDNSELRLEMKELKSVVEKLQIQLQTMSQTNIAVSKEELEKEETKEESEEEVDLFGSDSDEEDEEKERIKQQRLEAYAAKKAKKGPGPVAKSSVVLDCKPWDDETDMKEMENLVRKIEKDGLVWGASKLVPLAYGIKKLQIMCVVEDEKVSIEELCEQITENYEDYVQSVDIASFNKI